MKLQPSRGVYILECLLETDPGSEGLFLAYMFRMMGVPHQYIEVRTRDQFLALLTRSPYEIIHISTHGKIVGQAKRPQFAGLWFPDGAVGVTDLRHLNQSLRGYSVVLTACESGQREFVRQLIVRGGCRYVIAPKGRPKFHNSIFFAHILYHQYFILGRSLSEILKRYDSKYKNPHQFVAIPLRSYGLAFVPD